jgi:IS1 family transposase
VAGFELLLVLALSIAIGLGRTARSPFGLGIYENINESERTFVTNVAFSQWAASLGKNIPIFDKPIEKKSSSVGHVFYVTAQFSLYWERLIGTQWVPTSGNNGTFFVIRNYVGMLQSSLSELKRGFNNPGGSFPTILKNYVRPIYYGVISPQKALRNRCIQSNFSENNPRTVSVYYGLGTQESRFSLTPGSTSNYQSCNSDNQTRADVRVVPKVFVDIDRKDSDYGGFVIVGGILAGGFLAFCGGASSTRGGRINFFGGAFVLLGIVVITTVFGCLPWNWLRCLKEHNQSKSDRHFHSSNTVPRKYLLTSVNYRGTIIAIGRMNMANVLPIAKQVAVISALAEGSGIRQAERMTGVNRETIMKLGVRVGKGCTTLLDRKMRGLTCHQLQFDELWGFIGKKERHVRPDDDPQLGDVWTFCAIDRDTKLVPSFKIGKRDLATANAFVADVASRVKNRVQISSDALKAYVDAIEMNFGADVDFAQIVKTYIHEDSANTERKYSASEIVLTEKKSVTGFPNMGLASTSHVERLNGTTRLHMRRLTRLTYAFSKKLENFEAAVGLHFAYYNFVKRHNTLRVTPAMEAGIERDFWTVENLLEAVA